MLVATLSLGVAGCVSIETRAPKTPDARIAPAPAFAAVCDRLYFGRAIPGGGEVSEMQWHEFVAGEIAPRFPNGFTTYRAAGHWRGDDGATVSEQTMVLEVIHAAGDAAAERAVDVIARTYRARFHQDAVMRVRIPAEQNFLRR